MVGVGGVGGMGWGKGVSVGGVGGVGWDGIRVWMKHLSNASGGIYRDVLGSAVTGIHRSTISE